MANEITVVEMQGYRGVHTELTPPFIAVQTLSINGAVSTAFNKGTSHLAIRTTTDCHIEFSKLDGTAPDGAGAGSGVIPLIAADGWLPFSVRGGDKVKAVT